MSEHFSITWSDGSTAVPHDTDLDGDGVPDAIERLAADLEAARSFLLNTLGYSEPPGAGPYPLYIGAQGGYTRSAPSDDPDSRPSYIVVPAYLVGAQVSPSERRAFSVHEYMHAVQEGYDHGEDHWIMEATSTWVEDLFDDLADTNHDALIGFVPLPTVGLADSSRDHEYGSFLFLQFLTEYVGGGSVEGAGLIRELWERMTPAGEGSTADLGSLQAIDALLSERGIALEDAWREFMFWRWRLSTFEEGRAYRDSMAHTGWPNVSDISGVGTETCRKVLEELPSLSGDYVRFIPSARAPSDVPLTIVARAEGEATGFALIKRRTRPEQRVDLVFDELGVATFDVFPDDARLRRITLGLANASLDVPHDIEYSARWSGRSKVAVAGPSGPSDITFGLSPLLSGSVSCRGVPAPFAEVLLTGTDAHGLVSSQVVVTDEDGEWSVRVTPENHSKYQVEVIDPLLSGVASDPMSITVHLAVFDTIADQTVAIGDEVIVTGQVLPAHPGAPLVLEFRRPESSWRMGDEGEVASDGRYQMSFIPPGTGIWEVRVSVLATLDTDHAPGDSGATVISVSD